MSGRPHRRLLTLGDRERASRRSVLGRRPRNIGRRREALRCPLGRSRGTGVMLVTDASFHPFPPALTVAPGRFRPADNGSGNGSPGMATIAAAAPNAERVVRAPRPSLLWAIALAGLAASACTVLLALTSDHIREPGVHAGLQVWGCSATSSPGVVAWWRRPESRFGLLMVLRGCGLVPLESLLGESRAPVHDRDRVRPVARRGVPARVPRVPERAAGALVRAGAARRRGTSRVRCPARRR